MSQLYHAMLSAFYPIGLSLVYCAVPFLQRTYSLQDLSKSDLTQKGIHSSVHPLIQSVQQVPIAVVTSHLAYFFGLLNVHIMIFCTERVSSYYFTITICGRSTFLPLHFSRFIFCVQIFFIRSNTIVIILEPQTAWLANMFCVRILTIVNKKHLLNPIFYRSSTPFVCCLLLSKYILLLDYHQ